MLHPNPNDEPNVGREHGWDQVPECGLCRCPAHNVEDEPGACDDCLATIAAAARMGG